jgi:hypothetical protein
MNKIERQYNQKKILYVRLELIKDFFYCLLHKINATYLGDNLMSDPNRQAEHFEWCLKETVKSFKDEGIVINISDTFQKMLLTKYQRYYYNFPKIQNNIDEFRNRIYIIFTYNTPKTEPQLKEMFEYYDLFSKNLG